MKIADLLVLPVALLFLAAEPGGVQPIPPGPPPIAAGAAGARPLIPAICPTGSAQDRQCLASNGAIGSNGAISSKMAKALLKNGTCPCQSTGGKTTTTLPASTGD